MSLTRKIRLASEPVLNMVGWLFHSIYSHSISTWLSLLKAQLHTAWLRNSLRKSGKGVLLYPSINLRGGKYISVGDMTVIGKNVILNAWDLIPGAQPSLIIGKNCDIGEYSHISCANSITIGNGVLMGRWITIVDNSHGHLCNEQKDMSPIMRPIEITKGICIEDNVWIGDKATILPGVTIGKGSIVAANAVVTKDVPPYSISAGCPAKTVRTI